MVTNLFVGHANLVSGRTVVVAQRILEEIFSEQEMLIIHKVHLEMSRSNPAEDLVHEMTPSMMCDETVPNNEIIIVDDEDNTAWWQRCET